mmetsp:Transcript_6299/g.13627  ORF Transcript_6299/g.13627 Transcript_6299/m.13627 type:complete len:418 (+) Transcript_6299:47-1300(+)
MSTYPRGQRRASFMPAQPERPRSSPPGKRRPKRVTQIMASTPASEFSELDASDVEEVSSDADSGGGDPRTPKTRYRVAPTSERKKHAQTASNDTDIKTALQGSSPRKSTPTTGLQWQPGENEKHRDPTQMAQKQIGKEQKTLLGRAAVAGFKSHKRHVQFGRGVEVFENGGFYRGDLKFGLPHGQGTLQYDKEGTQKYVGEFFLGKFHGHGIRKFVDGSVYDGQWEHGLRHGEGLYRHPMGKEYRGEWKKGQRCGKGAVTFYNGDKFTGRFKDNLMSGVGKYEWTTGAEYQGHWKGGVYDDFGWVTTPDGDQEVRVFRQGDLLMREHYTKGMDKNGDRLFVCLAGQERDTVHEHYKISPWKPHKAVFSKSMVAARAEMGGQSEDDEPIPEVTDLPEFTPNEFMVHLREKVARWGVKL